jgi:acyl-CoA dehydrogenase
MSLLASDIQTGLDATLATALPRIAATAAETDRTMRFPTESLAALRESGLMGLLVPTSYGGMGADLRELVYVAERIAAVCLSTALIWTMHCQQVDAIVRFAGVELRDHVLPAVAADGVYLGSVTTESGKGGHLLTSTAALTPSADAYQLIRDAPIVTGGAHADAFLIKMRSAPDAPDHDVSLVYADRDQLDIEITPPRPAMGMRGTENVRMRLTGSIPKWQTVGDPGQFRTITVETFAPIAHLYWSACWLGAARSALAGLIHGRRTGTVRIDTKSDLTMVRIAHIRHRLETVAAYLGGMLDEVIAYRALGRSLGAAAVQIHLNTLKVLAAEQRIFAGS